VEQLPPGAPGPAGLPPAPTGTRRGRPLIVAAAVAAALLLLVALTLVVRLASATTVPHAAPVSASPTGTPLSPEAYQQKLTALDQELTPLVQAMAAATTHPAVTAAATALKAGIDTAASALDKVTAPARARAAHQHLVKAVHELVTDAGIVADESRREVVCTGGAAVVNLARDSGGVWLRAAVEELSTADPGHAYHVGTFLPDVTPVTAERHLDNGTMLKRPSRRGANTLTVGNTGIEDAVVIIAPQGSKTATLSVYVRSAGSKTVTGVPDGTYQGYTISGRDWDSSAGMFSRHCHYALVDGTLAMTSDRSGYTDESLTGDPSDKPFFGDQLDPGTFPG
jgi:hypothetical protein